MAYTTLTEDDLKAIRKIVREEIKSERNKVKDEPRIGECKHEWQINDQVTSPHWYCPKCGRMEFTNLVDTDSTTQFF